MIANLLSNRMTPQLGVTGILLLVALGAARADFLEEEIGEIFNNGKVNLDVRSRYEYNNDSRPGIEDVNGYSIRTRLGFTTDDFHGFKAMIEAEDLSFLDDDDRPPLDVPTTDLNQLWLSYTHEDFGSTKLGRQIYTLDDHRFVGHVGWRQNIQTFDGVTAQSSFIERTTIKFGFLDSANRINDSSQDLNGWTINATVDVCEYLSLTGFGYFLDFDQSVLASSDTYGLRAFGKYEIDEFVITYAGSYAYQEDSNSSLQSFDNSYYAFDSSVTFFGVTLGGGLEVLEGDGTTGFTTPLATVHKFNGWADVFAARSLGLAGGLPQGLEDYYIKAGYKVPIGNGIPLTVVFHWFETENNDTDLGTEIDFLAKYKINNYLTAVAKYAYYDDDDAAGGYFDFNKTLTSIEINFKY